MDTDKELLNYLLFINLLSWGKYGLFLYIFAAMHKDYRRIQHISKFMERLLLAFTWNKQQYCRLRNDTYIYSFN